MNIKERIKSAREGAGLSQSELARQVGVTPQAVQSWEDPDGATPRLKKIKVIAEATGVRESWILSGSSDDSDRIAVSENLAERERMLLDMYRCLEEEQQVEFLRSVEETKQKNDKIAAHYKKTGRA